MRKDEAGLDMQVNALSSLLHVLLADTAKRAQPVTFATEPAVQPPLAQTTMGAPTQSVQMLVALAAAAPTPELERRRKATIRAEKALDALEMLQAALVVGVGAAEPIRELRTWSEERMSSDDPELDGIMDEIDLRIQVELAKLERG